MSTRQLRNHNKWPVGLERVATPPNVNGANGSIDSVTRFGYGTGIGPGSAGSVSTANANAISHGHGHGHRLSVNIRAENDKVYDGGDEGQGGHYDSESGLDDVELEGENETDVDGNANANGNGITGENTGENSGTGSSSGAASHSVTGREVSNPIAIPGTISGSGADSGSVPGLGPVAGPVTGPAAGSSVTTDNGQGQGHYQDHPHHRHPLTVATAMAAIHSGGKPIPTSVASECADNRVIKNGWLHKRGKRKNWARRWFVLRDHQLSYYKDEREYKAESIISTADIMSAAMLPEHKKPNHFAVFTSNHNLHLQADNGADAQEWVDIIKQTANEACESGLSSSFKRLGYLSQRDQLDGPLEEEEQQLPLDMPVPQSAVSNGMPDYQQYPKPGSPGPGYTDYSGTEGFSSCASDSGYPKDTPISPMLSSSAQHNYFSVPTNYQQHQPQSLESQLQQQPQSQPQQPLKPQQSQSQQTQQSQQPRQPQSQSQQVQASTSPTVPSSQPQDPQAQTEEFRHPSHSHSHPQPVPVQPHSHAHVHTHSHSLPHPSLETRESYARYVPPLVSPSELLATVGVGDPLDKEHIIKRGYLLRLKRRYAQWRRQWVVLTNRRIVFYKSDDLKGGPIKVVLVENIVDVVDIDPLSKSKKYCMQIITPEKRLRFCAEDEEDLTSWLASLKSVLR
ncbi:hypothetical protein AWJ20_3181 [Sugiyamaella lignohabitans]|uniref:PH domain-containing protein n=1 Tax=Sugiyamaella lignohabitans TaxID=796027 RepID=A0A167FPY7_9ASCO|nr:uncharacterized protein AWJ20_3181 [Sugiyamaella lignohabitans]ANB15553.1 hypothetical protein AWJ20_3181 [Sugiyamaella lignohabitans]